MTNKVKHKAKLGILKEQWTKVVGENVRKGEKHIYGAEVAFIIKFNGA